jgi:magnesium-transporting ATPase (P-type)
MAIAAGFLPFLPLLPRQILLLNFLSDIPGMTIAGDSVDPEQVQQPRAWNLRSVRTFVIVFGLLSSVFDILTFLALRLGFGASATLFRSGWFIESTVTELAVMLVLRTNRAVLPKSTRPRPAAVVHRHRRRHDRPTLQPAGPTARPQRHPRPDPGRPGRAHGVLRRRQRSGQTSLPA